MTRRPDDNSVAAFDTWKAKVDAHIARRVGGLTSSDLPGDAPYRRWFDSGMTPSVAARTAISMARMY